VFFRDTRILSRWDLRVDGEPPEPPAAMTPEPYRGTFLGRLLHRAGRTDTNLLVQRDRRVGNGLREDVVLRNSGGEPAACTVTVAVEADFADLVEVKEGRVQARGEDRRRSGRAHLLPVEHPVPGRPTEQEFLVEPDVVGDHALGAEAALSDRAAGRAVELGASRSAAASGRPLERRKPVTPSSTISGAEPTGVATTGVPVASASIITRPNGSAHCMGFRRANESPTSSSLSAQPSSPRNSTSEHSSGLTSASKYSRSAGSRSLAAMRSGTPAARGPRGAARGPDSGR
jgi:hypothetical protein